MVILVIDNAHFKQKMDYFGQTTAILVEEVVILILH